MSPQAPVSQGGLNMRHPHASMHSSETQSGFSLIEILVGLVISLLVTLVIMQVFSVFEGQKRSTTGTADAQTNGNIGLYNVQRDVQLAGYGLPVFAKTDSPLLCTTPSATANSLSPIIILDGGTASDSVSVRYGSTPLGGVPVVIASAPTPTSAPMAVTVQNNMGCAAGDTALITSGTSCVLVEGAAGVGGVRSITGTTNITLRDGAGVATGASIACLGSWRTYTYAVNSLKQLTRSVTENGTTSTLPNVAEIVNLQAQYGVSATATNNQVVQWVDAAGATWGPTITPANRNRIKAVRIAIVARNGLLEKEDVTTACSSTTTANPTGLCAWDATSANPTIASPAPTIDLSSITDWQKYRYRVFETIIPIRSMIWSKDAL